MKIGLVGFSGSGKSTVFQWLTGAAPDPGRIQQGQTGMAKLPDARVDTTGATTLLESCDPGSRAKTPNDVNIHDAIALAAGRDTLTATLAAEHVSGAVAACAARLLVEQGDFRDALMHPSADVNTTRREQLLRESVAAGAACRADSQAGLP